MYGLSLGGTLAISAIADSQSQLKWYTVDRPPRLVVHYHCVDCLAVACGRQQSHAHAGVAHTGLMSSICRECMQVLWAILFQSRNYKACN